MFSNFYWILSLIFVLNLLLPLKYSYIIPLPSFHPRPSNEMAATTLNKFDEGYGDDSFLIDFDVDAVVDAARKDKPMNMNTPELSAKRPKISPEIPARGAGTLEETLQTHLGFSTFRPGQKEVIEAILRGQDVAVFWATGSGKSICYQIPALYTRQTAFVISPLISLMQDQVHKINGKSEIADIATYLGSGQLDKSQEEKAMRGEYLLVYLTPEKLLSTGFLDRMAKLNPCLIAVDESHCVR